MSASTIPDAPCVNVNDPEWIADCKKWRGIVLTGKRAHWCPDWDYLPVDETMDEFDCCFCWDGDAA